jgi:hypothetical protein
MRSWRGGERPERDGRKYTPEQLPACEGGNGDLDNLRSRWNKSPTFFGLCVGSYVAEGKACEAGRLV